MGIYKNKSRLIAMTAMPQDVYKRQDHRLLIERVLRVEEAHLGPDFFGPDGRTVRRRNPWLTPLGRGLGGDRKGQIGHLLNADMGLGETEFP